MSWRHEEPPDATFTIALFLLLLLAIYFGSERLKELEKACIANVGNKEKCADLLK